MTDKPTSSLYLRVISGVILAPAVLFCMMYGGIPFLVLIGAAIVISCYEWGRMSLLSSAPFFNAAWGTAYILLCIGTFVYLRLHYTDNGVGMAICMLLAVWASDSGAYFAGKTIGGPKMAPAISPNKTWAGMAGGIISSIAAMFFYAYILGPYLGDAIWSDYNLPEQFTPFALILFGAAIAIGGQIGDLLISKQKRKVGVKDTGSLIPGHGGILDRIDSLLFVSPIFLIGVKALGL
jgi:phosphatidate cytidylyltransferase